MRTDYRKQLEALIALPDTKSRRLLLHACCGPCSCHVLEYLSGHFEIGILFYNPNIQPQEEYFKRLLSMRRLIEAAPYKITLTENGWNGREFDIAAAGLEDREEGGKRCEACFLLRLEKTARAAKERGFEYFCTTMTVSPRKNADIINETGSKLAEHYGVKWLPSDFKKNNGFKRTVELSEKYGLYRQDYCGCLYSRR